MFHFAVPPPPPPPPPLELYLLDAYTRGFRDASSAACFTGGASAAHAPPLLPTAFPHSHCHTAAAATAAPPAVVPVSAQTAAQTPAVRTAASSAATLAPPPPRKRARQEDGGTGVASGGGGGGGGKDASGGEATDDDDDDDDGDEEDGGEIVLYQKGDLAKGAGAGSAVHRDRAGEEGWEGEGEGEEEEEEEVLSDEGGAPAADAPAAEGSSVNDAWISMFVDSEKRRRAKAAEKEEERKRFARRPVEREDERRLAERTAMYGADAAREVAKAECRLHALHGRRARGRKFPAWPCVPVYFDPNSLEERKLGFHGASGDGGGAPLLIQTRALSAAERERGVVPAEACKEAT